MKTTYLVWKDPSCGGVNAEWQELTGIDFLALVRSDGGKGRYFVRLGSSEPDGSDGNIVMESTQAAYADWKREKNHRDYIGKVNSAFATLSYQSLESDAGDFGEELLRDESANIEDDCLLMMDKLALKEALAGLSEQDVSLLSLFYAQRKSQPEIAEKLGISQQAVSKRLKKILAKLCAEIS